MHPAYFAMVMATGIVSIASFLAGFRAVARGLMWLNIGFYSVLWVMTILRCMRYPRKVRADILHHGRSVGFFTTVAGTCVLGSQLLVIGGFRQIAVSIWYFGIALWAILTYGIVTVLTVKREKPGLAEGINGGWLVLVVAAQSVAVLGAQLSSGFAAKHQPAVLFFCLCMWLGGGMLYIWIISLIFYRYTFFVLSPTDLAPPYWINMGAVAISTLAGTMLLAATSQSPVIAELSPFIKGMTLLYWSTATWWIPMLAILGVWRHIIRGVRLEYDPLYWGAVFPLGMYTACTFRLAYVVHAEFLLPVPRAFVYIAIGAWSTVIVGLTHHLLSSKGEVNLQERYFAGSQGIK